MSGAVIGDSGRARVGRRRDQPRIPPALLAGSERPANCGHALRVDAVRARRFGGSFGLDLSHYTFDIKNSDAKCSSADGYEDPACSCTVDWTEIKNHGLRYVYSKASDGRGSDLSFRRVWSELEYHHRTQKIFRGAYHFLRPTVDADMQADTFLRAIGAVDGKKPLQLPPVLDIEWSNKRVLPGTEEFMRCPASRRVQNDQGNHYCDMWHTMKASEIAALAKRWIDRVEAATGRPVIIYTNPTGWWNEVMTKEEDDLLADRAVWTSRYTRTGPAYVDGWERQGGSSKWKMAPLPRGASYPKVNYDVPHFWQFTESGHLPSSVLTCAGREQRRYMDMNWVPIPDFGVASLFGVKR